MSEGSDELTNFDGLAPFHLNGWRVETDALRLVSPGGDETAIGERAMAVLGALAAADGAVVTKNHLMETVWRDVAVTENSLSQAIKELSQAFRDDADKPKFIETIRGRGFRLLAPATIDGPDARDVAPARPGRRRFLPAASATLAGAAAILGAAWLFQSAGMGSVSAPSPDGVFLATLESKNGAARLLVMDTITGLEQLNEEIPAPESLVLTWSPDSTRIALNATRRGSDDFVLNILSMEGGPPKRFEFAREGSPCPGNSNGDERSYGASSDDINSSGGETASSLRLEIDGERLAVSKKRGSINAITWQDHLGEPAAGACAVSR